MDLNGEDCLPDWSKLAQPVSDVNLFRIPRSYYLDVSKIKSLEDVILVINAMQIIVSENYEDFDKIKHLLTGKD